MKTIPIILLCLALIGCNGTEVDQNGLNTWNGRPPKQIKVENDNGQITEVIPYEDLTNWLCQHKNIRIWSFSSLSRASNGSTTCVLIVYEKVEPDDCSCPVCGQKMPPEKINQ